MPKGPIGGPAGRAGWQAHQNHPAPREPKDVASARSDRKFRHWRQSVGQCRTAVRRLCVVLGRKSPPVPQMPPLTIGWTWQLLKPHHGVTRPRFANGRIPGLRRARVLNLQRDARLVPSPPGYSGSHWSCPVSWCCLDTVRLHHLSAAQEAGVIVAIGATILDRRATSRL